MLQKAQWVHTNNRLQVFQVGCIFFSTNSEIIGVWKTRQFSSWLTRQVASWVWQCCKRPRSRFCFSTCSSAHFQLPAKCSPTHLHPAHLFLLSPIPWRTFAVIDNYSHHPQTGGEYINTLHFFCFWASEVIWSWWIYTVVEPDHLILSA